ncbi:hypothetical protein E_159 [Cronobacter phage vB_CsaM_leE]|jgi:hypothetical protein|uniref:Uncharacterized protein n=6 Tax=Pseudotevenvirus TaxID=2842979 RepID=A0A1W5N1M8_9CAUD|nr:hypothetical protein HWB00_gp161 [Cronobacter phage vB_CsaM_leB]YP_009831454.1 hypothetical protein HWB01_gp158 [Cronobacter phage vB_CsaM_leE]AOG16566.1 hypothetical protein N_161 [Cronobacter phage vB_CsaM_leN]QJI53204.1 hypothetical protein EBPL_00163 [Enterobacter phage EBPL]QPX73514.1 hypothetical protein [Cronobacter phage vB_CsaM_Cronuts]QTJ24324.1 hypothetical protein [Enterobacter phage PF-CE2]UGO54620.1 hypothetical protein BANACH_239 [Cronobacter phage vB_CsaD_Banach]UGV22980.1
MTKAERIINHLQTGFPYQGDLQRDIIELLSQHDGMEAEIKELTHPDVNVFASLMDDVIAIDSDELICIETTNPEDKTILKQAYERIEALHDRLFTLTFPNKNDRPC